MSDPSNLLRAAHYMSVDPATVAEVRRNDAVIELQRRLGKAADISSATILPLRAGGRS